MKKDTYHHGDLKAELIKQGLHLLAREGMEGFSMRKLAALCSVSHAAPYKHFKSKEELILAISRDIAVEFSQALREGMGDSPQKELIGLCLGYYQFFTQNPDYFRFVFMVDHGRPLDLEGGGRAPENPISVALQTARKCLDPAGERGSAFTEDFLALWSMLHGFTLLSVNHTVRVEDGPEAVERMLDKLLKAIG